MAHTLRVASTAAPSMWRPVSQIGLLAEPVTSAASLLCSSSGSFDRTASSSVRKTSDSANDNFDIGDSAQIAADLWLWAPGAWPWKSEAELAAEDLSLPIAANIDILPTNDVCKPPCAVSTVSTVSESNAARKLKADKIPRLPAVESRIAGKALLGWASMIKLSVVGVHSDAWFYPTVDDRLRIANHLKISFKRVSNFCHNYRKRFTKIDGELVSSRALIRAAGREKQEGKK
jgi:hypothetical protein